MEDDAIEQEYSFQYANNIAWSVWAIGADEHSKLYDFEVYVL